MSRPLQHTNPRRSLRSELTLWMVTLAIVPLAVTNAFGYLVSHRDMESSALRELQNAAVAGALEVRSFARESDILVASIVASNEQICEQVLTSTNQDADLASRAPAELSEHLLTELDASDEALAYMLLGPTEQVLAASTRPGAIDPATAEDLCLSTPDESAHRLVQISHSGDPILVVRRTIADRCQGGTGSICGVFGFAAHRNLGRFGDDQRSGTTLYVTTATGEVVCGSFHDHTHFGEHIAPQLEAAVLQSARWVGRYERDGTSLLAATSPVQGFEWSVVAQVPYRLALAPLDALKWRAIAVAGTLVLLLLGATWITARRISAPIVQLAHASERLSGGELGLTVPASGPREVSELASRFNEMSTTLQRLKGSLEERVRERTADLAESRAFAELLFDAQQTNLMVVDAELEIIKANHAAETTYGECLGRRCYEVCDQATVPCPDCPAVAALEGKTVRSVERTHFCRGTAEIVHVDVFPLEERSGQSSAALIATRIITEDKNRQAQLVHHERMSAYALLTASLAHEIGNPLSSIHAQLQLARRSTDPENARQTLDIVSREIDRIQRLLDELRGFVRRRNGDSTSIVAVSTVVHDALRLLRHDHGAHRVTLTASIADAVDTVRANPDDLLQVLINLGLNALHAANGAGTVVIATRSEQDRVIIEIIDHGPGIPETLRDRVFEPFFTTRSDGDGTGLGLFVCKRLVTDMDGTLEIFETPGGGATFRLSFPAVDPRLAQRGSDNV